MGKFFFRGSLPWLIVLLSGGLPAQAASPAHRFQAGRPLLGSLERLRAEGLDLVYSSDLVRASMRVLAEPVASTPRAILDELIAPHGLEARDGPGGTVLIVKRDLAGRSEGSIAGRVVLAGDRGPMPGARVSVSGNATEVLTAPDGRFLIFRLPPGKLSLDIASADGTLHETVEVTVKADQISRIVIELNPARTLIEGIVVTPTRYRIVAEQPEARHTAEGEKLTRLAHLGDDAYRAAARVPGAASGDKSAKFNLRGGEWNETLVLLDGLEIDQPFHLEEFLAFSGIVNSRAIERIDLLTGGFPVEYGDRMSGVMELTSSVPSSSLTSSMGAGSLNSWVMTQGRTNGDDKRWLLAARGWYPDSLLDLVDPGGEDLNPGYYDLMGKFELHRSAGTSITGNLLAARDQIRSVDTELGESAKARSGTTYGWINIKSPWTTRLFSQTQLSAGKLESNRHGTSQSTRSTAEVIDERVSRFLGFKQDWLFRGSDRFLAKWGFDARTLDAEYDYVSHSEHDDPLFTSSGAPVIVDRDVRTQPSGNRLGAYAAVRGTLLPRLTAEAGLRWSHQSYSSGEQLDPRINLVVAAGIRSTLRASWGIFHQPQRIDELQVEDGVTDFFPAQRAEHRLLSFERQISGGVYFRADAYWKVMSRLHPRFENLFNPIVLLPESEPDRVAITPRRGTARGIEVFLENDTSTRIVWRVGYALAAADDRIAGRAEPRSWDQRHALDLGLGLRFDPGWEIDFAGIYHSGWPTTSVSAVTATDPNGMITIQPTLGPRNAERFSPYHRLDVKVLRRVQFQRMALTMFLEVLNLYGRNNPCCVEDFTFVPEPGGNVLVERNEGSWLGRVPSFGVSLEF